MKQLFVFFWLWLATSPAVAIEIQTPDGPIDGPLQAQVGESLDLVVKDLLGEGQTVEQIRAQLANSTVVYWPRENVRVKPILNWQMQPEIVFQATAAGTYMVGVPAAIDGTLEYDEVTVVVGDGGPAPDPTPPPDPEPSPTPEPGHRWVVIVEETSLRGSLPPAVKQTLLSKKWRDFCDKQNNEWKVLDQHVTDEHGNVPTKYARFLKAAKNLSLPAIVIGTDSGVLVFSGELPDSPEGVIELIKEHGG